MTDKDSEYRELMARLLDLHKQATTERSHFYVARCAAESYHAIESLLAERDRLRNANKARADYLEGKESTAMDDYLNECEKQIAALRAENAALHAQVESPNNRLVAFLSESVRMIEGYMRAGWLTNPAAIEQATDFIQRARLAYSAPSALPENK